MKPTRPLLRWHGGKWKLAPWIIRHFPPHKVYVEPFGGAASVLLRKPRAYTEVYNDLDDELVNLFTVTRDHGAELRRLLELTPFARMEFQGSLQPSQEPLERARRLVVRSFMGYGSNACNEQTGFRANTTRTYGTPASNWADLPEALDSLVQRLRGVIIEQRPAQQVMMAHDGEETLHYVDPPYALSTRGNRQRYRHELTDEDHRHLAGVLRSLRGMVVMSGYASPLYQSLFPDWSMVTRWTMADGARPRMECLWLNRPAALKQGLMLGEGDGWRAERA